MLEQIQNHVKCLAGVSYISQDCSDHQVTGCKIHFLFSSGKNFTETEIFSFSAESILHQLNEILLKGKARKKAARNI